MQKSTTIAPILYQCLRVSCLAGTLGQKQLAVHGILMQFSSFVYMVSELYSHNRGKNAAVWWFHFSLKKTGISTPEGKTNISWEQYPSIKQPTIEISASGKIATFHDNTFLHVIGLFKGLLLSMSPLVLLDSLTQGKSFLSDFYRFFSCCYC